MISNFHTWLCESLDISDLSLRSTMLSSSDMLIGLSGPSAPHDDSPPSTSECWLVSSATWRLHTPLITCIYVFMFRKANLANLKIKM